jgi:hypothetical protein
MSPTLPNDPRQTRYDFTIPLKVFQIWLDLIKASNHISDIQLYVALPTSVTNPGQLQAARKFVQSLEQKSGLTAKEISYAPMPKEGWTTMEIYFDGKENLPQVFVNGLP